MCTVTFLPSGNSFILTSNRDEKSWRKKASPPRKFSINNQSVFYPKDLEAGGTWIATANSNFTLCLLNGAFQKHYHQPPYKKSRGLMVLDFFWFNDVSRFSGEYDFTGIEPFTLIIVEAGTELKIHELRWDEKRLHFKEIDGATSHIWSSVTLYDEEIIEQRQQWFRQWLNEKHENEIESIMHFHEFGGTGNKANDLLMNRNNTTLTVSITSIQKSEKDFCMKYKDVTENKLYNIRIM